MACFCRDECHAESANTGGDAGKLVTAFWMEFGVWFGECRCIPAFGVDAVLVQAVGCIIGELCEKGLFCTGGVCGITVVCPVGEPVDQGLVDVLFEQEGAVFAEFVEYGDDAFEHFTAVWLGIGVIQFLSC